MFLQFPKNFYWGTATSAYQVEGGIKNDWSEAGEKYDAGRACDHYNRFEEDFDLAQSMHNNAHRFSIEWARIEPEQGKFDQEEVEHYRKVILALRERGLEPFVTLNHYTLPIWFARRDGWLCKENIKYFIRYAEFLVKSLPQVKFWITFNEPYLYSSFSFFEKRWPPFDKNFFKFLKVLNNLLDAHNRTYQMIHKNFSGKMVGMSEFVMFFSGFLSPVKYIRHSYFLNKIKNHQDFFGLDYYLHHSLSEVLKLSDREKTDMGWEICSEGIYHVLKDLKKYNKPIYITENGLADAKDEKREKFIINHLKWTHKAIEEGINVQGYFHWSLLDNFEWDKGFEPRFGLVKIDYKNNLKRIPRPSSKIYAEICKNNGINIL
jgi:beta-glucosidase